MNFCMYKCWGWKSTRTPEELGDSDATKNTLFSTESKLYLSWENRTMEKDQARENIEFILFSTWLFSGNEKEGDREYAFI